MVATVGSATSMWFGTRDAGLPVLAPLHCAKQGTQFGLGTGKGFATELGATLQGGKWEGPGRERSCLRVGREGTGPQASPWEATTHHNPAPCHIVFLRPAGFHPTAWMEHLTLTVRVESRPRKPGSHPGPVGQVRIVLQGPEAVGSQGISLMGSRSRPILGLDPRQPGGARSCRHRPARTRGPTPPPAGPN